MKNTTRLWQNMTDDHAEVLRVEVRAMLKPRKIIRTQGGRVVLSGAAPRARL